MVDRLYLSLSTIVDYNVVGGSGSTTVCCWMIDLISGVMIVVGHCSSSFHLLHHNRYAAIGETQPLLSPSLFIKAFISTRAKKHSHLHQSEITDERTEEMIGFFTPGINQISGSGVCRKRREERNQKQSECKKPSNKKIMVLRVPVVLFFCGGLYEVVISSGVRRVWRVSNKSKLFLLIVSTAASYNNRHSIQ